MLQIIERKPLNHIKPAASSFRTTVKKRNFVETGDIGNNF